MPMCLNLLSNKKVATIKSISDLCCCNVCNKKNKCEKNTQKPSRSFFTRLFNKKSTLENHETFIRERLFSLGIVPGVKVKMIGESPLKDPIIVEINGSLISLRKVEADLIMVEE